MYWILSGAIVAVSPQTKTGYLSQNFALLGVFLSGIYSYSCSLIGVFYSQFGCACRVEIYNKDSQERW